MTNEEFRQLLIERHVLTEKGKKKNNWKDHFDDDLNIIFLEISKNYRIDDEAWFCILHLIEPVICEVCGNLATFAGTRKSKYLGYNSTCENCSANLAESKKENARKTINLRTPELRHAIKEKQKATNKILHGDENYGLFGSASFKQNMLNKYGNEYYSNLEKTEKN